MSVSTFMGSRSFQEPYPQRRDRKILRNVAALVAEFSELDQELGVRSTT